MDCSSRSELGKPPSDSQEGSSHPSSTNARFTELDTKFGNLKDEIHALYVGENKTLSKTMQLIETKYGRIAWQVFHSRLHYESSMEQT